MPHVVGRESLDKCDACALAIDGKAGRPVFGWTDADPASVRVAFVMEAPGRQEHRLGRPAIGQSGRFFDACLKTSGLSRESVFVTNSVVCHPPQNRDPTASEMICCGGRLEAELRALPNLHVIVPVGAQAVNAITGVATGITKSLYRIRWSKKYACHVVPMYHPAFILRQPALYPDLEHSLSQVKWLLINHSNHLRMRK